MIRFQTNNPLSCLTLVFVISFLLAAAVFFSPVLLLIGVIYAVFARSRLQSTYAKFRNQARNYTQRDSTRHENMQDNDTVDVEYTVLNEHKEIAGDGGKSE